MKIFNRLLCAAILVSVICNSANAQSDYNFLKYTLKTNVFQWTMNEPNIAFEYRFSPRFGWENTIGTYGINNRSMTVGFGEYMPLPQSGIVLRSNLKWYYKADSMYNRGEYYISPMLLFKKNYTQGSFGHWLEPEYRKENSTIVGASVLYGVQTVMQYYLFDFYFGGGLRYKYIRGTSSKIRELGGYNPVAFSTNEWQPSIHFGVKMGYNFRGTPHIEDKFNSLYLKHSITTNILSTVLREQNLSYEYRVHRRLGLEVSAGSYLIKYRSISYASNRKLILQNSNSFSFLPKFYLSSPRNYNTYSFYLSTMFSYKNESFSRAGYYQTLKVEKIGPSLVTGCQVNKRHLVLNFFIGAGYLRHNITRRVDLNNTGIHEKKSYDWKLAAHGGVKIGYGFKLID